jgi:hypothetical protein
VVVGLASPSLSEALRRSSGSSLGVETLLQSSLVSRLRRAQNGSTSPSRPVLCQLEGRGGVLRQEAEREVEFHRQKILCHGHGSSESWDRTSHMPEPM